MSGVEQRALRIVRLGLIVGGLVVAIESAVATHQVAVVEGVREDTLAWLTPVGIEGLACACVAAHVYRRAIGQSSWLPLTAAAAFGALAVWINMTAVSGSAPIAYAMAASAPIGLMIIVHVYPWITDRSPAVNDQLRIVHDRSEAMAKETPTVHDRSVTEEDDRSTIAPDAHRAVALDDRSSIVPDNHPAVALHAVHDDGDRADCSDYATDPVINRLIKPVPPGAGRDAMLDRMLAENPEVKGPDVAEELGLSVPSGRRVLRDHKRRRRSA